MLRFTSIDLQKQTGNVQRAASTEGAIITSHGRPRNVMLSLEEFLRLKKAAGESVAPEFTAKRAVTVRHKPDPLGYDVANFIAAARHMADDVLSGRVDPAIQSELEAVRKHFRARLSR